MLYYKNTWKQRNKDYKEELLDALCFLNMASPVGYKVVSIPDCLHSSFHTFVFSYVLLEVLRPNSNSKNMLFIQNRFRIIVSLEYEIHKIHKTQTKWYNSYKKVFTRSCGNFLCFNTIGGTWRRLRINNLSSSETSWRRVGSW